MSIKEKVPETVRQYLLIYLSVMLIFSVFRLILFLTEIGRITAEVATSDILHSFLMGLRFDLVISGYILFFPFFISSLFSFFNKPFPLVNKVLFYLVFSAFTLTFMVCAMDIPYFNQFFSRFSITAFEWLDSPGFVFKMIVEEPRYWLVAIPFLLLVILFYKLLKRIFSGSNDLKKIPLALRTSLTIICLGLIFLGIRGRVEKKSPIRVGTAYFSNNPFLNQLGLNPNFTLIRSYIDSKEDKNKNVQLMDNRLALSNVQRFLGINHPNKNLPLLRNMNIGEAKPYNYNVVLVIMEGMSVAKMERGGNNQQLTPFLDSLSHKGYYFENAYSAGIHTFNGIFSSLFSMPALFRQHPMKESSILKYHGLFSTLKNKGYSSIYFTTHDGQFDNVEGFLKANDCETVISQANYPTDKIKTTLGVPDDYLFEYAMPVLNGLSDKNKPFVAAFMTASDHGPYYIPNYFKPRHSEIKEKIVEYADFSLRKFIKMSSKQKWFKNTLFVFVADHGAALDNTYEIMLAYNHVPLLFYGPDIIKDPKTINCMAGQIDIFPTIMGVLKQPYANNTLGIDLLSEARPYIFFNADDKYGVIDQDWLLIGKPDGSKKLYKYQNKDIHNYAAEEHVRADKMNDYAKSNLQVSQDLILKNKQ
jgi:phosphoglycerol transferase MdoB-like AlkP superfamily enzyme